MMVAVFESATPRRRTSLLRGAAAATVVFIVLFWRLGSTSFWDPAEAHYAETTRELLATGDWWAPYYNEQPFFDKPILFHNLQAVAMLAVGQTEWGARIVPALAVLALVLFTGWLGHRLISPGAGFVSALLVAVNPASFALARYAILDALFTALLFAGVGLIAVAALRDRPALQWAGYVLVGCAVMVKGPLALVLSGLANLSDQSGTVRLDYTVRVLTYLDVNAYGMVDFGQAGDEFTFAITTLAITNPTLLQQINQSPQLGPLRQPIIIDKPILTVGGGLRLSY